MGSGFEVEEYGSAGGIARVVDLEGSVVVFRHYCCGGFGWGAVSLRLLRSCVLCMAMLLRVFMRYEGVCVLDVCRCRRYRCCCADVCDVSMLTDDVL